MSLLDPDLVAAYRWRLALVVARCRCDQAQARYCGAGERYGPDGCACTCHGLAEVAEQVPAAGRAPEAAAGVGDDEVEVEWSDALTTARDEDLEAELGAHAGATTAQRLQAWIDTVRAASRCSCRALVPGGGAHAASCSGAASPMNDVRESDALVAYDPAPCDCPCHELIDAGSPVTDPSRGDCASRPRGSAQ